jgi:hypothetical protein
LFLFPPISSDPIFFQDITPPAPGADTAALDTAHLEFEREHAAILSGFIGDANFLNALPCRADSTRPTFGLAWEEFYRQLDLRLQKEASDRFTTWVKDKISGPITPNGPKRGKRRRKELSTGIADLGISAIEIWILWQ